MKAFTKTLFFAFLVMSFVFAGCSTAEEVTTEEPSMEMEVVTEDATATEMTVEVAPETTEATETATEEEAAQ